MASSPVPLLRLFFFLFVDDEFSGGIELPAALRLAADNPVQTLRFGDFRASGRANTSSSQLTLIAQLYRLYAPLVFLRYSQLYTTGKREGEREREDGKRKRGKRALGRSLIVAARLSVEKRPSLFYLTAWYNGSC